MRSMTLVLLAALTVTVSGCFDADGPDDGTSNEEQPAPEAPLLNFTTSLVDDTYGTGEPSILAAPDGTLWIAGPTGFAKGIVEQSPEPYTHDSGLFESHDGGETWQWNERIPGYGRDPCLGGGDSDIAASPDGALFLIDLNLENVPIDVSYDNGETWVFNCNSSIQPGVDRQWVAASQQYVWISVNSLATGPILYRADRLPELPLGGGLVFGPPVSPPVGGMVLVDQDTGTLYLAGSGATIGVSHDDGDTWETKATGLADVPRGNSFVSIALDAVGNVFVATSGSDGVVVSGSSDQGATWTEATVFHPYEGDYGFAWVAAGGEGTVDVAWYGRPAENDTSAYHQELYGYYLFAGQSQDVLERGANATKDYAFIDPEPVTTKNLCTGINLIGFVQCDQADPTATRALGDFFESAVDLDGNFIITYVSEYNHDPPVTKFAKQTSGPRAPPV